MSFTDIASDGSDDLKLNFRVVESLGLEVQSNWARGPTLQSRIAGSRTIDQKTIWPGESPLQSTALLLRHSKYIVGQTISQVGIRPISKGRMAAGLTIGYTDPSDFYFSYLDLKDGDCTVRFGRVKDGSCHFIKNITCDTDVRYGSYRILTVVSEPLEFRIYLDSKPIGAIDSNVADYSEGSAGLLMITGSANFAGLSIGPPKISTKIAYSANVAEPDWRDEIIELYDLQGSKTIQDDTAAASSSAASAILERDMAYHCTTYKPTHILPEELICSDENYWRFENRVNGTSIWSVRDLKSSDELEQCIVGNWSCRDSEISARLTFNSDGEAGLILRSYNDTLFTMVTLETVSQKVTLSEMSPNSGVAPIWQMVSSIPIVAHETNLITVRDLNGKISVAINGDALFETWAVDKAASAVQKDRGGFKRIAYAGGFVVRRGNVKFEDLALRGL